MSNLKWDLIIRRVRETVWIGVPIVIVAIGLHAYRVTLPKLDAELDETHRASVELGLTAMETRKLTAAEGKALPVTQAKINSAIDNANALIANGNTLIAATTTQVNAIGASQQQITVATVTAMNQVTTSLNSLQPVMDETRKTVAGIQPVEQQITSSLVSGQKATDALTGALSDPAIHNSATNIQKMTGDGAEVTGEVKDWVHGIFHPTWWGKVKSQIQDWGALGLKLFI